MTVGGFSGVGGSLSIHAFHIAAIPSAATYWPPCSRDWFEQIHRTHQIHRARDLVNCRNAGAPSGPEGTATPRWVASIKSNL